jgi:RNA polymerase sigma factor (sigma-70 family)
MNNSAAETPGQNPSQRGDNPENLLYEEWKAAPDTPSRQAVEYRLLPLLRTHASKICWVVLHSNQSHLAEEMAADAILELRDFEERSLFSTWVHSRFYNRARVEFRKLCIRREVPQAEGRDTPSTGGMLPVESELDVHSLLGNLKIREQEFVRLKVFEGYTDREIGEALGVSEDWARKLWIKLRKKMRALYVGQTA